MKIAVLGGSGFIGIRLCASLSLQGHEITAIARRTRPSGIPASVRYVQATMDDIAAMEPVLADADYLIHCAWDSTPGTSQMQPTLEAANNLTPTLKLVEQMQRHHRCRIVFISSGGAVFRNQGLAKLDEESRLWPRSYYGAGKIAVEQMLRAYHSQTGNGAIVVRPSNIYGPGQQSKRLFAIVPTVMRCLKHDEPFEIWGDGETVRDYLYAGDFDHFISRLLTCDWRDPLFEVFHAGSGEPLSINGLCEMLEDISGKTLRKVHRPTRTVDSPAIVLDSTKAQQRLDWRADTKLGDGLTATWKWFLRAR